MLQIPLPAAVGVVIGRPLGQSKVRVWTHVYSGGSALQQVTIRPISRQVDIQLRAGTPGLRPALRPDGVSK